MSRKPPRRRAGPPLSVPDALLATLGPIDPRRIAPAVAATNAGLTGRAWLGRPYLRDDATREAYRTYYLCANAPKLWAVLDRLDLPNTLQVLELGAGPGTGVAALATWAQRSGRDLRHLVTDALDENLRDAQRLAEALGRRVEAQKLELAGPWGVRGRFDLVVAMNVVCELPGALDPHLVAQLEAVTGPGGTVVVIEPASREASGRALALRDALVAAGWVPRWPCPHAAACPTGWCHAEWRFERPAFMAEVDRRVGTRREVLKATCFALRRGPVEREAGLARVISERHDEKGRSYLSVCRDGADRVVERQRRDVSDANRDFGAAVRFDLLRIEGGAVVGDRLRLGAGDTCARVEDGGW